MTLRIGTDFAFPPSAVTEVISVLATRGAGKSFGSADLIEEVHELGVQTVVIDPMGVYWGLRSSKDGKRPGLPLTILGGERGDVPLEPTSGKLIADVIVDSGQSFILDLSLFDSKAEQVRFMEALLERLFYRKGPIEHRTPLMLVVDEADEFAPQKPERNETRMLGHMIRLAKRGRTRGIGLVNLTQRSADFSKAVLDLSSAVLFMRTTGPRDRKAIKDWLAGAAPALIGRVDEEFPKLQTGQALVYSPHWLGLEEPRQMRFRMIRTFDSYATPEPGAVRDEPRRLADIDLDALGAQIAATVERAKDNDPEQLRRKLAATIRERDDLAARLETAENAPAAEPTVEYVDNPVLTTDMIEALAERMGPVLEWGHEILAAFAKFEAVFDELLDMRDAVKDYRPPLLPAPTPTGPPARAKARRAPVPARSISDTDEPLDAALGAPMQKILDALAWFESFGLEEPNRAGVAFLAGVRPTSGGFKNNMGKLKNEKGVHPWDPLVDYPAGGRVCLTEAGRQVARFPDTVPTVDELQRRILDLLPGPMAAIVEVMIDLGGEPISREDLADQLGVSSTSGGYKNNLGKLHNTLELIDYPSQGLVAGAPVLFGERILVGA